MERRLLTEFYDDDAERFWDPRNGMRGRDLHIYPLLNDFSGTVLEYGAGSGSLLLSLAIENRFDSLIGVDISEVALKKIANAWDDVRELHGEESEKLMLTMPVEDKLPMLESNSVDLILSLDTIEHVLDPYTVLDELYRVAKRGASCVISVPNYGYIKHIATLLLGRQPVTGGDLPVENWREAGWDGWHLHTFTKEGLNALLRDCGWNPVLWTGYGDRGKNFGVELLRRRYPALLSGALTVVCEREG